MENKLHNNIESIRSRMQEAAAKANRNVSDILLCAACKTQTVELVRASAQYSIDLFGENHAQELIEKYDNNAYLAKPAHFIGHLQSNKVKYVVGRAEIIQSVDSIKLLKIIEKEALKKNTLQKVLIEINIGDEESKSGIEEDMLPEIIDYASTLNAVSIRGLMCIPPICESETEARRYFADLRELFEKNKSNKYDNIAMEVLSMGMSSDYEAAILEGSTMIRVGTAIYGARKYKYQQV